jgi:hypothetical protein
VQGGIMNFKIGDRVEVKTSLINKKSIAPQEFNHFFWLKVAIEDKLNKVITIKEMKQWCKDNKPFHITETDGRKTGIKVLSLNYWHWPDNFKKW